jgi:hypothetical protein
MDETHTNTPISTVNPGADASGVSEPSFVEALVNPGSVFRHPQEVAHHPWFTDQEKRAVLLSWVRDELVAEQVAHKAAPELELTSRIDAVIEALARYDLLAAGEYRSAVSTIRKQPKQRFRRKAMH